MFKKFVVSLAVALTAVSLYAQKPVYAAVVDIEDDPTNGLEMVRSLFNEYYLSELTTHAKVTMEDTATVQKAMQKLKLKRGNKLSNKQIADLCKEMNLDALCSVKMARKGKQNAIYISIVSRDGTRLGNLNATIEGIGDADAVSANLASASALLLRKLNQNSVVVPSVEK